MRSVRVEPLVSTFPHTGRVGGLALAGSWW
jgi:hypothetical protein